MKHKVTYTLKKILGIYFYDLLYWWYFFRRQPVPQNQKPNLLIINHVFDQDLQALELANTAFNFIVINAFTLRIASDQLFPKGADNEEEFNGPKFQKFRATYRIILRRFVAKLIARYRIQAVVAPSDNFFYVRDLVPILHEYHLPYYVIDKEGTICPAYFIHFARYIRDHMPLLADHILVWSERQKNFWEQSGVSSDRITVTGQPRSDFWKQKDRWKKKDQLGITGLRTQNKLLLFFTYDPWAYTPAYMVERGEMHWDELRSQTHQVVFDFAKRHPEYDIVIKAHPQQLDIPELLSEIQAHQSQNVHLATGSELSNNLILAADVILGFQSTALIEAMITDHPIIYTFWGEAKDRWSEDLIPFHKTTGVRTVTSSKELAVSLEQAMAEPSIDATTRQARDAFVAEYFTGVDGQASARTLMRLEELLREWHKHYPPSS